MVEGVGLQIRFITVGSNPTLAFLGVNMLVDIGLALFFGATFILCTLIMATTSKSE